MKNTTIPAKAKVIQWIKLISITGGAQGIIQLVGLVSGIFIVRILPVQEYALYTLANSMLGTMNVLADGGISVGVMAEGGKVWQDRDKLGSVLTTGLDMRKKSAAFSLLIMIPVLLYMLRHNGGSWLMSILIVLSLIPTFFMALTGMLHEIALKLHQDIVHLQKVQVGVTIGRLAILLSTLFLFPFAFVTLLGVGIPQIWGNIKIRKITKSYANWKQKPSSLVKKEIWKIFKRILPDAIYYCLAGQITVFLISLFGTTSSLAQIGALARITSALAIFSTLSSTLIIPRFARLPKIRTVLMKHYLLLQLGYIVLSLIIISLVWLFSSQILWILGANYYNLNTELILSTVAACITITYGVSFTLCTVRGWVINPIVFIPLSVIAIIVCIKVLDITTLKGVILLNISVSSVQLIAYIGYCLSKIYRVNEESVDETELKGGV